MYYVDRYSGLAADWDQNVNYQDENSINEVAEAIDGIIEEKYALLNPDYLTIVGGDEIIPFYRLDNPDILRKEGDSGSTDPVLEIVNHNHIPTDNIYSDLGGSDLDDWTMPELSIGRISSATSKDMEIFIENSLRGPSINNNAILANDETYKDVDVKTY